ncbi:DNA polymerase III subunit gamma/tau [Methylobacter tundripaludum]|uniref:DNA polymerase III subunit gamma/tau n=1 Tax=Methylobacter tundripaludum (strain ATCC BAA-1195 / DSM 17260 / SV96) TaxID=697282 RepID=G3IXX1_METTV|nr:DNA polymerase III subunit gamma/tau [Methylobacter tundripaludum]EGW19967.1 DNA polymerase III, subunits gamma and tau [Methylobacter tundripaludum SV96]
MNYQVLARKWRPHNFTEVVGQEHVVKSLMNALQHDRLHHAYLFTGTRGVGKTTIARILAKAINCENLQDFNPCGVCSVCRDLDEGRFLDLIEVDAASRTKVEDTRDLLDNAQYAPNHGRYKVYLIDEVHMLSGHSFNALLKTLEEPPAHVKFLLATTDPHKIPVTVLSRCLQFNLKRLLPSQIFTQMEFILQQEHIEAESGALKLLSRAADGSMRDGLSLLDQAIVYGNGKVGTEDVNAMLGTVAQQPVEAILTALAEGDAAAILDKINEIANLTPDFSDVLQQILQVLHRIALLQQIPNAIDHDFDVEMIAALAAKLTPEDVQLYYQIGLVGQRDLDLAPDPRSGFEMVMLRMLTFRPVGTASAPAKPVQVRQPINKPQAQPASNQAQPVYNTAVTTQPAIVAETTAQETVTQKPDSNWAEMVAAMKINGLTRELAHNCVLENIDDSVCTLILDPGHKQLRSSRTEDNLQKALQAYRKSPLKLVITTEKTTVATPAVQLTKAREDKQQAAVDAINSDENVQALKEHLGARIMPGTIEPI